MNYLIDAAVGTVSVQANCTVGEAILLLHDRAHQTGQTMDEIAFGVMDRRMYFYR